MTSRSDVLEWSRSQAVEADIVQVKQWLLAREAELTKIQPWAKQVSKGKVRVKGAPAPKKLHGRIGEVVRETKNPMKLVVRIDGEPYTLHSAALEDADDYN